MKKAPWSKEVVNLLKQYQQEGDFHPYTCECTKVLVPTREGWICDCGYTQDWVPKETIDFLRRRKKSLILLKKFSEDLKKIQ